MEPGGGSENLRGPGQGTPAGRLALDVSAMQAELLSKLGAEMHGDGVDAFAAAAQRLAEAFGSVTAAAVDPLAPGRNSAVSVPAAAATAPPAAWPPPSGQGHPSLYRGGRMRDRLEQLIECHRRYRHPFCLALFDVAGPAVRNGNGGGSEPALAVLDAALRESIRIVDETYRLEEDAVCVLAPEQDTVGGVQMSERLLVALEDLEAAGGLPVHVSAGVVACPEHGSEADLLLRKADDAMWRARAVGQPVGVGSLQDR